MLLVGERPVSQSCRENGKVGSMEGLCSCFVCIDWSHGPSTGTITDGHRARYGIVVCSLVTALEHKWRLETGPAVCSPGISSGEDVFSRLIYSELGESRGQLDTSSPFCEAGQGVAVPTGLHVSFSFPFLQSRMVRNETPYFIWTTRRDVLDCRFLSKDQMINHYARAGSFTTKVGIPGIPTLACGLAAPFLQRTQGVRGFKCSPQTISDIYWHGDCGLNSQKSENRKTPNQ